MTERNGQKSVELPQGSSELREDMEKARQRASWILPIAAMLKNDVLSHLVQPPQNVTGIFIGPGTRGFVEANAFRIACAHLGIAQYSTFLVDVDFSVINRSITDPVRNQLHDSILSTEEMRPFIDTGLIRLGNNDFTVYTSKDFISVVNSNTHQELTLPPIVMVKGDAGDLSLSQAIVNASPQNAPLVVIGRNIDSQSFSYKQVVKTWVRQINLKSRRGKASFLAFTATDQVLAEKMYEYIINGIDGFKHNCNNAAGIENEKPYLTNIQLFTGRSGSPLSFRPELESRGANFSDNYIHIIGGVSLSED